MDKEEILNKLKDFLKVNPNPYTYARVTVNDSLDSSEFKGFISDTWTVGGRTGGSCWNSGADISVEIEEPHDLILLDEFLELHMPELSFVKYRNLLKLVNTMEWTRSEYYGNYYNYKCKYISFEDIVNFLTE